MSTRVYKFKGLPVEFWLNLFIPLILFFIDGRYNGHKTQVKFEEPTWNTN